MSTATRKIGSCPPHVHAFLKKNVPRGVYMALDSGPCSVGVSMRRLAVETLRALSADDGVPQEIRDDAKAELARRGLTGDVEAARRPKNRTTGNPTPGVDPQHVGHHEAAIALSHRVPANSFVAYCTKAAKRA